MKKVAMRKADYVAFDAWTKAGRGLLTTALALSAFLTGVEAILLRTFYGGEDANLVAAVLLLFAGVSAAFAVGFRRVQSPTWKHWSAVAILAIPGGLFMLASALR